MIVTLMVRKLRLYFRKYRDWKKKVSEKTVTNEVDMQVMMLVFLLRLFLYVFMLTFQDVVAASIASSDSSPHSLNISSTPGISSNDSATCSRSIYSASHSMNGLLEIHIVRVDSCSLSLSPGESLSQ